MPRIMPILSVSALVGSHSERHVLLVVTHSGRHLPRVCVPSFLASFALSDGLGVSALDADPWRHCLWFPIETPQPFRQYVRPGGDGGPHASKVPACGTGWALNDESTITQPRLSPKTPILMGCERALPAVQCLSITLQKKFSAILSGYLDANPAASVLSLADFEAP